MTRKTFSESIDLISQSDIAVLASVSRAAVSSWRKEPGFPGIESTDGRSLLLSLIHI